MHAQLAANLALHDGEQTLHARLGLRQRLSGDATSVRARFALAPEAGHFRSDAPGTDRSTAIAGLDWQRRLTPALALRVQCDAELGRHERAVQAGAELAYRF